MRRPEQKIIFVTGKGGVGKTAVAAAVAQSHARRGKAVLLAELGEKSFFQHVFPKAGQTVPQKVAAGLDAVRWQAEICLREYVSHYVPVSKVVDLFFANPVMRTFINAAPALQELALLGKITSGPRGIGPDLPYDVIVVDAFSTGHFKALCLAPLGMAQAVRIGPMAEQSRGMVELLRNPNNVSYLLVTLPEELPMNESEELIDFIRNQTQSTPTVVLNRLMPIPAQVRQTETPPAASHWRSFIEYLKEHDEEQRSAKERIKKWDVPSFELPMVTTQSWPDLVSALESKVPEL